MYRNRTAQFAPDLGLISLHIPRGRYNGGAANALLADQCTFCYTSWRDYIDVDSFVDYLIVQEISKNVGSARSELQSKFQLLLEYFL